MLGVGNGDLERFIIMVVVLTILAMLVRSMFYDRKGPAPQVPPTVSPLLHPLDEDVRVLKHFAANVEQRLPDLTVRVVRHDEQIKAVREDLVEIKTIMRGNEHMLKLLVETGLKREGQT